MDTNENIIVTQKGSIKVVRYNRPSRKNAIDEDMYLKVMNILNSAATDNDITVMVLTGSGDFYSSGNDFKSTAVRRPLETNFGKVLHDFIKAFITFPKLLVAVVNGPAIGIAATTLAMCDLVFASEHSYFYTPFTKLGIVAEGCSSFTFPRLLGERKAAEMLLFNHKMSAKEALEWGFVNYLYKPEEIQSKVWDKITEVSNLPTHSLSLSKKFLKGVWQEELLRANKAEIDGLTQIWTAGLKETRSSKSKI